MCLIAQGIQLSHCILMVIRMDLKNSQAVLNIFLICSCLLGIFVGPLMDRLGYRELAMGGAGLVALGYILTSQVNNVYVLFFTHATIPGY